MHAGKHSTNRAALPDLKRFCSTKYLIKHWTIVKHLECPYTERLASGLLLKETQNGENGRQQIGPF